MSVCGSCKARGRPGTIRGVANHYKASFDGQQPVHVTFIATLMGFVSTYVIGDQCLVAHNVAFPMAIEIHLQKIPDTQMVSQIVQCLYTI